MAVVCLIRLRATQAEGAPPATKTLLRSPFATPPAAGTEQRLYAMPLRKLTAQ